MRRDLQWRETLRREMRRQIAEEQGLVPYRVVARVVDDERTVITAAIIGPSLVAYVKRDDGEHHRALVADIYRAQVRAAS